jgi:hypothetical protein
VGNSEHLRDTKWSFRLKERWFKEIDMLQRILKVHGKNYYKSMDPKISRETARLLMVIAYKGGKQKTF